MDTVTLWRRPSVHFVLGFVCGTILTWAALAAFPMLRPCVSHTVKFIILGPPDKPYYYIMTDGTSAQSFTYYGKGESVCLP